MSLIENIMFGFGVGMVLGTFLFGTYIILLYISK